MCLVLLSILWSTLHSAAVIFLDAAHYNGLYAKGAITAVAPTAAKTSVAFSVKIGDFGIPLDIGENKNKEGGAK